MRSERSFTQRSWSALRATLIGCGLSEPLLRRGLLGLNETRRLLALRHLPAGARGLEIGALHCPLPLPPGAQASTLTAMRQRYCERCAPTPATVSSSRYSRRRFHARLHRRGKPGLRRRQPRAGTCRRRVRHAAELAARITAGRRPLRRGADRRALRRLRPRHHARRTLPRRLSPRRCGRLQVMRERNRAHVEEYLAVAAPALAREQGQPWHTAGRSARARDRAPAWP